MNGNANRLLGITDMARIKCSSKYRTETYQQMRNAATAANENNDCSVVAVAVVCGVDYATAHKTMADNGRKKGCAACNSAIKQSVIDCGKNLIKVTPESFIMRYSKAHRMLKNVTTHHPERFNKIWADGKTYMIFTKGHVLSIVNGENHDWTKGKAKRARYIYEVV